MYWKDFLALDSLQSVLFKLCNILTNMMFATYKKEGALRGVFFCCWHIAFSFLFGMMVYVQWPLVLGEKDHLCWNLEYNTIFFYKYYFQVTIFGIYIWSFTAYPHLQSLSTTIIGHFFKTLWCSTLKRGLCGRNVFKAAKYF